MHSGAGRIEPYAIWYAETAVETTAGLTSTQPARPCSEAFSAVALVAEASEPPPVQLADVATVLIVEAMLEPWWVAANAVQAAWFAKWLMTPAPALSSMSFSSGVRAAHPGSAMRLPPYLRRSLLGSLLGAYCHGQAAHQLGD